MGTESDLSCPKCNEALKRPCNMGLWKCVECRGFWSGRADSDDLDRSSRERFDRLRGVLGSSGNLTGLTCPECHGGLHSKLVRDIEFDWCLSCGGVFLDLGELERVPDLVEPPKDAKDTRSDTYADFVAELFDSFFDAV
jgi:Zn-finger nucleic acid-binding protein